MTDAVRRALAGRPLQVVENRALRSAALRIFDRTFAVTEALRVLAVVVAFIGVWSALLALQVERTRELGTLLALGPAAATALGPDARSRRVSSASRPACCRCPPAWRSP